MDKKITELVSAFFVNEYLNKLRSKAKEYFVNKKYDSIEDAYKNVLLDFTKAFCGSGELYGIVYYNRVVQNFYATLYIKNINKDDKFYNFIDKTTLEFLPKNYYNSLGSNYQKKEHIICEILRNSVREFADFIIREKIKDVLDPKESKQSVVICLKKQMYFILEQKQNAFISAVHLSGKNHNEFTNSVELDKKVIFLEKQVEDLKKKVSQLRDEKNLIVRDRNEIVLRLRETTKSLNTLRIKAASNSSSLSSDAKRDESTESFSSLMPRGVTFSSSSLSNTERGSGRERGSEKKESAGQKARPIKIGIVELETPPNTKEISVDEDDSSSSEYEELEPDD